MHSITVENRQIKLVFDKQVSGWQYDKSDVKYFVDSYKDHATLILMPTTVKNFKELISHYANNDNYIFSETFLEEYQKELKLDNELATKRKLLKEKVTIENIKDRDYLLDYSFIPEEYRYPFNHQKLELEYAVRFPAFYSLDEMGLGKTRVAIERHRFLKERDKINKSFIICPVSLMYNWENEIKKWTNNSSSLMITGSKKNKLEEIGLLKNKVDFFIINFEGIESIQEELLNLIDSKTNIIIDEFIKIKNPTAKRSKSLIDLCNKTEYVMGLCGTPVSQGSIDLFSPSLCIDKGKKFGFSYERFIDKYFWKEGWNLRPKKSTYNEISEKLFENAIRFLKKDCLDIPDKMYMQIPIELPAENQEVYNQMVTYCLSQLDGQEVTAPIILVQLLRLSQITSGFIKTPENKIVEFEKQPKLEALEDLLDSNNGTSTIIWSRFQRDIKAIAKLCMDKNISFGCLIGGTSDFNYEVKQSDTIDKNSPLGQILDLLKPESNTLEAIKKAYFDFVKRNHPDINQNPDLELLKKVNALYNSLNKFSNIKLPENMIQRSYDIPSNLIGVDIYTRNSLVDKFQKGSIQVIIGTASTGGLGINLTKAERVIYYANDYSLINRLQSEDRAHRVGQKNKVSYYDLLARDTIDVSILKVLMAKKNVSDIITKDSLKNMVHGK